MTPDNSHEIVRLIMAQPLHVLQFLKTLNTEAYPGVLTRAQALSIVQEDPYRALDHLRNHYREIRAAALMRLKGTELECEILSSLRSQFDGHRDESVSPDRRQRPRG